MTGYSGGGGGRSTGSVLWKWASVSLLY